MSPRVLLRDIETGQFYAGPKGWTKNCALAHDFHNVENAAEFGRNKNLAVVEVVLRYADPACDLVLPVRSAE